MKHTEQTDGAGDHKFDTTSTLLSAIKFENSSDNDGIDFEYELISENLALTTAMLDEPSPNNVNDLELADVKSISTEKRLTYKEEGVVIKEETEINELVIKDEYDISSVVWQPRTTPHSQPSTEARAPGTSVDGDATPAQRDAYDTTDHMPTRKWQIQRTYAKKVKSKSSNPVSDAIVNEPSLSNANNQELVDIKPIKMERPLTYKDGDFIIKEEIEINELVIKDKLDSSPVVMQPRTTPHSQPSTEEHDFVIKEETEIIELVVKDELDISPVVLQPRTTPHLQPSTEDPAPGTSVDGDAAPARSDALFVQSSPQSEIKDQHYEDDRKRLDNPDPGLRVDTNASDKASETQALCEPKLRVYSAPVKSSRVMRLRVRTAEKPHKFECRASESCQLGNLIHIHADVKPLEFKQCDYKASQTNSLRNHMKKRMRKKTYQCKHCEYRSSQLAELIIHLRIHTGDKPYQRKQCEYTASHLVSLQRHMRKQMDEKPYRCDHCEYKSSHLSSLRTHMRIHTGEMLYQCKQCEYTASYPSVLQRHMYKHTGEKPYHCEHCDYATSQKHVLQRHMYLHTD